MERHRKVIDSNWIESMLEVEAGYELLIDDKERMRIRGSVLACMVVAGSIELEHHAWKPVRSWAQARGLSPLWGKVELRSTSPLLNWRGDVLAHLKGVRPQ